MHKLTYKFLIGLTTAALSCGTVPVMAEPLLNDETAADSSGTEDAASGETGNTEQEPATPDGEPEAGVPGTEQGENDPSQGDPSETDPSETDPAETDPSGTDPSDSDPSDEKPDGETGEPSEGDEETTGEEGQKDPQEDEEQSEKEDGKETEEESDQKKEDKDKKDGDSEEDSDSGKKSSDRKKDKKDKDSRKKKSSEKDKDKEETEERPELTEAERHPVIPRRTTLYSVKHYKKIKPVYILCKADEVNIREYPDASSDATIAAKLSKGAVVRLIEDSDTGWWFIETRDINGKIVRGYAESSCFKKLLITKGSQALKEDPSKVTVVKITNTGFGAVEKTTYDELAYSDDLTGTREDLVNYALQFLGNPYAEGGTSLTEGTDCAGLAKAVYAEFGISLPASLEEQYAAGTKIPVKNAQPGDLIYYINDNGAKEVMICLTNNQKSGQIQVLAVSKKTERIIIKNLNRNVMCRARTFERLNADSSLPEEEVLDLDEWNWVGESRISSYCYNCNTPANSAITASGIPATEWHTVAVDKSVIPLGSRVYIEGYGVFIAEDTGVKGKWCDLYVYNHECSIWDTARVYYQ